MHSRRTAHSGTPATTPTPPPAPTPTLFPYTTLFRSGTYQWLASYAGDANNNGFTTSCGDSGEQLTVIKATPTITTSASPAASQVVGTTFTVSDTATFHNAFAPTGSVSFTLYNSDCSVSAGVSGSGTISGNTATCSRSQERRAR